jgi:hypothetical protein
MLREPDSRKIVPIDPRVSSSSDPTVSVGDRAKGICERSEEGPVRVDVVF